MRSRTSDWHARWLRLGAIVAVGSANHCFADTPEQSAGTRDAIVKQGAASLEEVIVTAQRREERLHEVPMGITALTGDNLNRLQQRSFEEYASMVPGLSVAHSNTGVNRLTLRGLNANAVGSTVAVYVDDAPFGSSSALTNGSIFAGNFDSWDMQRIEVLRGPQGMFYGASSEGGLIKFVTNPPELGVFGGSVAAGWEHISDGDSGWTGKGVVNVPLGEKAAMRFSGVGRRTAGFIDDPSRREQDVNHGRRNSARASLVLAPNDDVTVRLTALAQDAKIFGNPIVAVDRLTRRPFYRELEQVRAIDEESEFRYRNHNATLSFNLGWASVVSSSSYGTSTNELLSDYTFDSAGDGSGRSNGELYTEQLGREVGIAGVNRSTLKKFTQELRLESLAGERLQWQVGAFYTDEDGQLYQPTYFFDRSTRATESLPRFFFTQLDSKFDELASFGNLTYQFKPEIDVQLGARWSRNRQSSTVLSNSEFFALPDAVLPGEATANKFLYSISPRWHVSGDVLVYARVASGYQPGGPNPLPPGSPPQVPTQFEPDSTVNYEVGARARMFDNRLSLDFAVFRIDWDKVQLNQVIETEQGDYGVIGNGGTARSQGLEWTVGMAPLPGLTLTWLGAYIDAELTSPAPAVGGESGQQLPGSPEWSSSLNAEYSWNAFGEYSAFIGSIYSYTGSRFSNFATNNDIALPPTRLSSYSTATLRLGLRNELWSVSCNVKNLTDKRVGLSFRDESNTPGFPATALYLQPRTIDVEISRKF